MVLYQRQKNCKLILLMLTWDCFLTYLLKIHEDLYQWNLCTLGWNLKVGWNRTELHFGKKQNNKTPNLSFSQLLMNAAFMGQYCLTRRHVATVAISREKVWSKKEKHQSWKTLSRWILQFKHNTTGKSFSNTVCLINKLLTFWRSTLSSWVISFPPTPQIFSNILHCTVVYTFMDQ